MNVRYEEEVLKCPKLLPIVQCSVELVQNYVNYNFVLVSEFQENFVLLWSTMAANNMYRVGDYVYVDQGPTVPFGVRRIDELQKSASGNVEMEVMIYLRRLDLSKDVLPMADENLKGNLLV